MYIYDPQWQEPPMSSFKRVAILLDDYDEALGGSELVLEVTHYACKLTVLDQNGNIYTWTGNKNMPTPEEQKALQVHEEAQRALTTPLPTASPEALNIDLGGILKTLGPILEPILVKLLQDNAEFIVKWLISQGLTALQNQQAQKNASS